MLYHLVSCIIQLLILTGGAASCRNSLTNEVTLEIVEGGSDGCGYVGLFYGYSPGEDIDITLSACTFQVKIYANRPNQSFVDIGRVTLRGGRTDGVRMEIVLGETAVGQFNIGDVAGPVACRNFGGLDVSHLHAPQNAYLTGTIVGDLVGPISVGRLYRLDLLGEVQSPISGNQIGADAGGGGVFEIGSSTSAGSITLDQGTIRRVVSYQLNGIRGAVTARGLNQSVGNILFVQTLGTNDLLGAVSAPNGLIQNVSVSGSIGEASGLVSISCKNGIGTIQARAIHANITANATGGSGAIQTLNATAGDFTGSLQAAVVGASGTGISVSGTLLANVTISGNVNMDFIVGGAASSIVSFGGAVTQPVAFNGGVTGGSVTTGNIASTLSVTGSLAAPLTMSSIQSTGVVTIGSVPSTRTVTITNSLVGAMNVSGSMTGQLWIGGSLSGNLTVGSMGNPGLSGQIIVNRGDSGATWTGTVRVNGPSGTVLSPNGNYAQASSVVGGGAVGEVPYRLYYADCSPVSGSYFRRDDFEPDGSNLQGVLIRFYGPILRGPGAQAVCVERQVRNDAGLSIWGDCSGMFTATVRPSGVTASLRTMRVHYSGTSGDLATGRYRISVLPEGVVCGDVPTAPDVDASVYYYFNIGLDCSGENCSTGSIGSEDFIDPESTWNPLMDCNRNNIDDDCELLCDAAYVDHDGNHVIDMCEEVMGPCPCDINDDNFLNTQDFFDFLVGFFGNDADFNMDSFTNSQDFFDFLTCFFAGCG